MDQSTFGYTYPVQPSYTIQPGYTHPIQPAYTNPVQPQAPKSKTTAFRQQLSSIVLIALAFIVFSVTAWFANATHSQSQSVHIGFSDAVSALRVLQELTSVLTSLVVYQTLETLEWILAQRSEGIDALGMMFLSPATSLLAVLEGVVGRTAGVRSRLWGFLR
jgi:hypothetical protein